MKWTEMEAKHKLLYVQLYVLLTMNQSGRSMSFRRWQELVVTELTPAHHSRENSQRSLTTHMFTLTPAFLLLLSDTSKEFEMDALLWVIVVGSTERQESMEGTTVIFVYAGIYLYKMK